jgi:flagellar biosynthetic protein FliR
MDVLHPALADVHIFLLIFVRITAMTFLLPIFGSENVPVPAKVGLGIVLSLMMMPLVQRGAIPVPRQFWEFVFLLVKELFVGMVVGYAASFLFVALRFAGQLIDLQMDMSMAQLVDPMDSTSTTVTEQLHILLFTIVFLLINGHYYLLMGIKRSFEVIPLLGVKVPGGQLAYYFTQLSGGVFVSAIKMAAPVYVTLTLTTLALGVVARTVPQMNVFFVGVPLKIGVGLVTMIIVLPSLVELFKGLVDTLMQDIWTLISMLA